MVERARVLEALYVAVDDLNQQLAPEDRLERAEATALTGDSARLDSLAFLNLVLAAETRVNARCSAPVNLAERLLDLEKPDLPATLGALASLIVDLQQP